LRGQADNLMLVIDVKAKTDASTPPEVNLTCTLENFKLNLFGLDQTFLVLDFDLLEFSVQLGKKPDARVVFHAISFEGPLHFIETLKNLIPLQAFNDPPQIDVDSSGITASISVALPAVAIGIFSLDNISLAASVQIPFIGKSLVFSFAFSSRDNPFTLTVALLGGGGFFGLEITPDGVQMLEAALEAGAQLSIDLGVASGSVSAMLGIYFRIENNAGTNQLTLTGYFRVRGEVDVLGLITASITLTLSLTYQGPPINKVTGTASLEIEIDILFFSATVTVTCQRQFAGSNGDPTFAEIMGPEGNNRPWNDYLAAFAA
jgi:hypothetical protein